MVREGGGCGPHGPTILGLGSNLRIEILRSSRLMGMGLWFISQCCPDFLLLKLADPYIS